MTVAVIWAESRGGVIGADGRIPWRLPADQAQFKALTTGGTVLMGRRTWDSLPASVRPLPGRRNVVLTRQQDWSAAGAEVCHDPADLTGDVWVIGGAEVYALLLPRATVAVLTRVELDVAGDAHAPELGAGWTLLAEQPLGSPGGPDAYSRLLVRGRETAFVSHVRDVLRRSDPPR